MSGFNELAFLDATDQANLIRRKEVRAIELVEAAIERIGRLNPDLNAVVTPMYEEARVAAMGPIRTGAGAPGIRISARAPGYAEGEP